MEKAEKLTKQIQIKAQELSSLSAESDFILKEYDSATEEMVQLLYKTKNEQVVAFEKVENWKEWH